MRANHSGVMMLVRLLTSYKGRISMLVTALSSMVDEMTGFPDTSCRNHGAGQGAEGES